MRLLGALKFKKHSSIALAERYDINTLKDVGRYLPLTPKMIISRIELMVTIQFNQKMEVKNCLGTC